MVGEIATRIGWTENTHDVRKQTEPSESMDGRLCGFRFLLPVHLGHEGDVDERKVFWASTELELSHRLDEGRRLNITNSSTELQKTMNKKGRIWVE